MEDEQKLEQEALAKIDEQKIREEIVAETGLDEVDNAVQIEKLVAREVKTRTFAANAIGTKVKIRTELDEYKKKNPPAPERPAPAPSFNEAEFLEKAKRSALEAVEQREFENLNLPDDLKATVKTVAEKTGKTYKQALEDPYVKFQLEQAEREGKLTEAAISPTHRTAATQASSKPPFDITTPEGAALAATPEGQAKMAAYRKSLEK